MEISVNGRKHAVSLVGHESLAEVVRDQLFLTGTKLACERGECGSCTVLVDGAAVYSCLTLAAACAGREVTTIEGVLARVDAADLVEGLHPVQSAFVAADAVQCGYCTPGQIMSAVALLERDADPNENAIGDAMSGNLCRCGTYQKIAEAIRMAAVRMRATRP
jgi:aerobic-type carbon monoxide dehydrogenase small subunit (CoxS/CutS family)